MSHHANHRRAEQICNRGRTSPGHKRVAKRIVTRARRRWGKQDPENACTELRAFIRGYTD